MDIRDTLDSGSLCSANLLGNNIGVEQAQELVKIKEAKPGLRTLCGFTMEETEVDLNNKGLTAGCAVLLASDIPDLGSMSSLNIANNDLKAEGAKHIAQVLLKW
jgi:hypothetical protein